MNRLLVALCALLVAAPLAHAGARKHPHIWTASVSEDRPGQLHLNLQFEHGSNSGSRFERAAFTGLTDAQIHSATRVPVEFELRREAGTLAFEGTFRKGVGAGEFTFAPDPDYARLLSSVGVKLRAKPGDEDHEQLMLAIFDVNVDYIRSMQKAGYRVSLEQYQSFRIFQVDAAYVKDMADVGFDNLTADKLVETRIHGATPEYIREMRAAGEDLSLDQYIQSRIFRVTPEFASEMAQAGYPNLDRETLVQFRIHGVSPDFIAELREVGYSRIPAQKLVEMRIHGVTPEFIRRVAAAGYKKVPVDKLVQMRIFDIEPEMVRALDDSGS